jgi:hypothetical protein
MKKMKLILLVLFAWLLFVGYYQTTKRMPPNTDFRGKTWDVSAENIEFFYDLTYSGAGGEIVSEQTIFDQILSLIDEAEEYILVDAFLFNSYRRQSGTAYRQLAAELTGRLVKRKQAKPGIEIDFITDPINTVYGGNVSEEIEKLKAAGVNVVMTDLKQLPDSNPIYSAFWRTFIQWFGNSSKAGPAPHPFDGRRQKVTLRSYLDMINFKANHRKIFMARRGDRTTLIITSGNPHDGSAAHSNVALKITGGIWRDVYAAEAAVAAFSGGRLQGAPAAEDSIGTPPSGPVGTVFITENQIKRELLHRIRETTAGDRIQMAYFYLSDRSVIEELVFASERGVRIRMILDPNKDAFGFEKSGIPNRPVAEELTKRSSGRIEIRWYDTHGEQFHSKMTMIQHGGQVSLTLGSANLTRRNLNNFNLEANVSLTIDSTASLVEEVEAYFDRIWTNRDGNHYTVGYEAYRDDATLKRIIYLVQEYGGLSSF